jgi:hypothetical protein
MTEVESFAPWKGRLLVGWPPPDRSWYRKAENNDMPVLAIHEKNAIDPPMPAWEDLRLSWSELAKLPRAWQETLKHWRGIYYIYDESDGKGYVGSACGASNLLGKWRQRLSSDAPMEEVVKTENSWKVRLCTRFPNGLNDN